MIGEASDSAQPELVAQLKSWKWKAGVKPSLDLRWRASKRQSSGAMPVGYSSLGAIVVGWRVKSHILDGDQKNTSLHKEHPNTVHYVDSCSFVVADTNTSRGVGFMVGICKLNEFGRPIGSILNGIEYNTKYYYY